MFDFFKNYANLERLYVLHLAEAVLALNMVVGVIGILTCLVLIPLLWAHSFLYILAILFSMMIVRLGVEFVIMVYYIHTNLKENVAVLRDLNRRIAEASSKE